MYSTKKRLNNKLRPSILNKKIMSPELTWNQYFFQLRDMLFLSGKQEMLLLLRFLAQFKPKLLLLLKFLVKLKQNLLLLLMSDSWLS